jgi:hypothetical protein
MLEIQFDDVWVSGQWRFADELRPTGKELGTSQNVRGRSWHVILYERFPLCQFDLCYNFGGM